MKVIYLIKNVGATYSSKIGLEESVDLEDISMPKSVCLQSSQFIVFDLETTGLGMCNMDLSFFSLVNFAKVSFDEFADFA